MANIFISYNRKSEAIARTLADDIEALGQTVWFDHELSGGQAWWDQILARIRDCSVFVFVLDLASLNSTACKREYGYAADLGKPILPVLVAEGVRETLLPPALSKIQFVDYRKQDRDAAFRLARALAIVPPPQPLLDPLPPPPEAPISYLGSLVEVVETTNILSYEDQSGLLIKLKRSFRDPETTEDGRMLLECLRRRADLNAIVRDEIDELFASTRKASSPTPPHTSEAESMFSQPPQKKQTLSILAENMSPEKSDPQSSATEPAWTNTRHEPTTLERVKAAGMGAAVGVAEVVTVIFLLIVRGFNDWKYYTLRDLILFPLGAAIAGAISGMNRRRMVAALVGMGVTVFLDGFVLAHSSDHILWMMVTLFPPLLGVLVCIYIDRKRSDDALLSR